jgi:outer membrane receptor protein involved in Fe transport
MINQRSNEVGATKRRWLEGVSLSLLAAGLTTAGDARAQQQPAEAPQPATPESERVVNVEAVVVTARRREERLIDVPVAATVLPRETLERYATTDLIQLQTLTPGVQISRTGGGTPGATVRIRGIGVFGPDYSSEQPVSVVIDGVPVSRGHIVDFGFFDQASLQVLKGPQALFFGKNAPAGVIAIDSASPTLGGGVEGYARASYGFLAQDPILEGAVSLPVSDKFAVRLALRGQNMQGGYIDNEAKPLAVNPIPDPIFGGQPAPLPGANYDEYPQTKQIIGRLTALWRPTENLDITAKLLSGYTKYNASFGNITVFNCGGENPVYSSALTGQRFVDTNAGCGFRFVTNDATPPAQILDNYFGAPDDGKYFRDARQTLASVTAEYEAGPFTLTSVTGYYWLKASQFNNYDQTIFAETPGAQTERTKTWTQELRAVSDFQAPVNFTLGAFYENEERQLDASNRIFLLPQLPANIPNQTQFAGASNSMINQDNNYAETYSVFGQLTWDITPTIELAGGARYTKSDKNSDLNVLMQILDILFLAAPGGPFARSTLAPAGTRYEISTSYDDVSPEVTLSWKPRDNLLVYGAYKTGFLAGGIANPGVLSNYSEQRGFSQAQRTSILSFGPETTKGFEVGLKGDVFDGRLTGDVTYFNYKFEGVQIATFNPTTATFTVGNAASAIDEGVEFNSLFRATENLTLRAAATYVDLQFEDYKTAPCYAGQPLTQAPFCQIDPADVTRGRSQDLSNTRFGTAPLSASLGFTYDTTVGATYDLSLSGDVQHHSESPPLNRQPGSRIPAYTVSNASARLSQADGPWSLSLIGTNLSDEVYINTVSGKPLGHPQDLIGSVGPGREIRLQLDFTF